MDSRLSNETRHLQRSFRPAALGALALTLVGALGGAGCAIANKGTLELSRHVSVGQELIDLKRALDEGAIDQQEYEELKGKIMEIARSIEVVGAVDRYTPDQLHDDDHDAADDHHGDHD